MIKKFHQEALVALRPGAEWAMSGDKYDGITWLDKTQPKPTEREFEAKVVELNAEPAKKEITSREIAQKLEEAGISGFTKSVEGGV